MDFIKLAHYRRVEPDSRGKSPVTSENRTGVIVIVQVEINLEPMPCSAAPSLDRPKNLSPLWMCPVFIPRRDMCEFSYSYRRRGVSPAYPEFALIEAVRVVLSCF